MVSGNSSHGLISIRRPTWDDYYEFGAGTTARASDVRTWTNKDQVALGHPVLRAGELADDEGAVVCGSLETVPLTVLLEEDISS